MTVGRHHRSPTCSACLQVGHRSNFCPQQGHADFDRGEPTPPFATTLAEKLADALAGIEADIEQHELAIRELLHRRLEACCRRDELAAALAGAKAIGA